MPRRASRSFLGITGSAASFRINESKEFIGTYLGKIEYSIDLFAFLELEATAEIYFNFIGHHDDQVKSSKRCTKMAFDARTFLPLPSQAELRAAFVGKNLRDVPTPAAVLDRAVVRRNCLQMLKACEALQVEFRPHVKTHKV